MQNQSTLEGYFMQENIIDVLNAGTSNQSIWVESSMDIWKKEVSRRLNNLKPILLAMPWKSEMFYQEFLSQTFHYVKHSVPLLTACHHKLSYEDIELRRRLVHHISEESGHEKIALSDLKQLGLPLTEELCCTRNLYQTQYFRIMYEMPQSLFGYILALEGIAALIVPSVLTQLKENFGDSQLKFLKLHSEEDEGHLEELYKVLSNLNETQRKCVLATFDDTLQNYFKMLQSCASATLSERNAEFPVLA